MASLLRYMWIFEFNERVSPVSVVLGVCGGGGDYKSDTVGTVEGAEASSTTLQLFASL